MAIDFATDICRYIPNTVCLLNEIQSKCKKKHEIFEECWHELLFLYSFTYLYEKIRKDSSRKLRNANKKLKDAENKLKSWQKKPAARTRGRARSSKPSNRVARARS